MVTDVWSAAKKSVFLFLCLGALSACGAKREEPHSAAVGGEEPYDWKEKGFVTQDAEQYADTGTDDILFTADRRTVDLGDPAGSGRYCVAVADDSFLCVGLSGDGAEAWMTDWGGSADGREVRFCPREDWGIENPDIYHVTVPALDRIVFFVADGVWGSGSRDWLDHYYAVYTDREGRFEKKTDLLPVLKEKGIWKGSGYAAPSIECDGEGNLCLWDLNTHEAHFLSAAGEYIGDYRFADDGTMRGTLKCFKADGRDILVAKGQGNTWEFARLDSASGCMRKVCTAAMAGIREWYGLWGNILYCDQNGRLTAWDISTGERRRLYDLAANAANLSRVCFLPASGAASAASDQGTSRPADGAQRLTVGGGRLFAAESGEAFLLELTDKEPESAGELLVANISGRDEFLQSCVLSFGVRNPLYSVRYQDVSREDGGPERIRMEMMKGGGPDILYVSWADMRNLWKNGALADLNRLISEENMEVLYPAARQVGDVEGKQAGLLLHAEMYTLWINGRYWREESWSREDVLRILRENGELSGIFLNSSGEDSYETNLRFFLGDDLTDSPYIRDGCANFDTEEFREILAWVKNKTSFRKQDKNGDMWENAQGGYSAVREGEYLGIYRAICDLNNYHNCLDWIGQDAHVAGLPSEEGRKIPLILDGMLVVNQNAADKPGVRELVNYLLDFPQQRKCIEYGGASVRSDVMERCIETEEDYRGGGINYGYRLQNGTLIILCSGEDGPPRLAEYDALWRDAVYIGDSSEELFRIIIEEANAYFESDKDPDQVIDSMTRRVQLYLDEQG